MIRRFSVKVAGKERVVDIDDGGDGGTLRIAVAGQALAAQAHEAGGGVWVFRDGDRQTVAWVDGENAKLTVEVRPPGADPVLVQAEVADARAAQAAALGLRASG